jgi:hypothetical protein
MNTTSSTNRPPARGQQRSQPQKSSEDFSLNKLRERLETHVKENPMKAVGQAMAAGYIIRFLPIRFMLSTALRLAPPLMLASRLWQGKSLLGQGQKPEQK